ncbi:hypothetical protein E3N88_35493 [Mikania micrantha]|uniref:Isopropylmalate dehydrogenase-like domain-containing protein n=1 Tax=Mikania micrantha TaxID=192012 RepID=A0A5N6M3W6_9ASTR|nr:hypothetical protein E3N88_35493 [Mikania micrantha]
MESALKSSPSPRTFLILLVHLKFKEMPMGGAALDLTGVPLPEETLTTAQQSDVVLLGAIGGYKWDKNEKHLKPETGLLQLREGLKVFANLRPAYVLPQLVDASTWKKEVAEGVDLMVVRELTGGIYFGKPRRFGTNENGEEIGFNTEVSAAYDFDTIVTNNIFGDILLDEASMITGSIGMLPSASLGESGPGLFEPIHDSAPDISNNNFEPGTLSEQPLYPNWDRGKDKANPLATILSAAMLLKYGLSELKAAERIELAVLDTLNKGFRTGDIYSVGNKLVGCKEMGEEVLKSVDTKTHASV